MIHCFTDTLPQDSSNGDLREDQNESSGDLALNETSSHRPDDVESAPTTFRSCLVPARVAYEFRSYF
jgi:hypothetical protein